MKTYEKCLYGGWSSHQKNIENTAFLFIIFHMNSHKSGYHCDTSPNINWQTNWSHQPQYIRRKSIWILLLETIPCKSISSCYLLCISPFYHCVSTKVSFYHRVFRIFSQFSCGTRVLGASPSKGNPETPSAPRRNFPQCDESTLDSSKAINTRIEDDLKVWVPNMQKGLG